MPFSAVHIPWLVAMAIVMFLLCFPSQTSALTTVPTKMNFQGRLTDSSGNVKANGTYNMRLRLYTVSTGGSAVWSEDRLVSASQGVTVTNGLFSIKLGDVTTLPASLFASGDLYLSVELPSPATATSSSPSWTEGAMTPRNQMATSAYAYNSETLDGLDSAQFARTDANNMLTGAQTVNIASTAAFDIQNGSAVSVLKVDTQNLVVETESLHALTAGTRTANVITTIDAGTNTSPQSGSSTTTVVGSDGYARISYLDASSHIKFIRCTNADCTTKVTTTVENSVTVVGVDIEMGSDGFARMSYYDDTNTDVKFIQCTNADCSTKNSTTLYTTAPTRPP